MAIIKILHSADIQIKARTPELFSVTQIHLNQLYETIKSRNPDVYIISGDLFEFGNTGGISDGERKLIYNHLSKILGLPTLKELVILDGNHDIHPDAKSQEITKDNALDIFSTIIKTLDIEQTKKLLYCNKSGIYSGYNRYFDFYVVSLRDGEQFFPVDETDKPLICLWHGMLKEYVESENLPIRQDIFNKLISIEQFPKNSWILSGDIHKQLRFTGSGGQMFIYPGSTMQHTHSEGTYIEVGDIVRIETGESKAIYEYLFDTDKTGIDCISTVEAVTLPDAIRYTTITLDHTVPFGVLKNQLKTLIFPEANHQVIKVKTANTLLQHENDIREIFGQWTFKNYTVSFDYEKFVQTAAFNNQTSETINKIIEEKSAELKAESAGGLQIKESDIITADNIDKLILNNQQIVELFQAVLSPVLKTVKNEFPNDITIDEIESDILAIFSEELDKSLTQSHRYNIQFKQIYTSGFMLLGENTIQLDIPGIIRILGTNGIGKTTLYNMVRWVLKGDLFEGMSKTTKVRNACMCFNNTKLTQDHIVVVLNSEINGQKVEIRRTLERKWKHDLSKVNLEKWEDSVSTVDQQLTVTIFKKDTNEPLVITGEKAQKYLDTWFGKTVDNIMILNHPKLERILKSPASELNELILEFIGVDYLKTLDLNLELVKSELSATKPKRDAESIFEARNDCNMYIKNINQTIEEYNKQVTEKQTELSEKQTEQTDVNDKLRNLGNVAQRTITISNEISALETQINTFEIKPFLEPKTTDHLVKPAPQDLIAQETSKSEAKTLSDKIDVTIPKFETSNQQIYQEINKIREDKIIELAEAKDTNLTEQNAYRIDTTNKFNLVGIFIQELHEKHTKILQELTSLYGSVLNDITGLETQNAQIADDILNGVCSKCSRPFAEDFEEHKTNLEATQKENLQKISELTVQANTIFESSNQQKILLNKLEVFKTKVLQQDKSVFTIFEDFPNHEYAGYYQEILDNEAQMLKLASDYNALNNNISEYQKLHNIEMFTYEYLTSKLGTEYPKVFVELVTKLTDNLLKIQQLTSKKTQVYQTIQKADSEIQEAQQQYNLELDVYNQKLQEVQIYNNTITESNRKIMEHNNQLLVMKSELTNKQKDLQILELQLPEYNVLYAQYNQLTTDIESINKVIESARQNIHVKELNRKEYENQLTLLDDEHKALIKYTKNQIIWKIYSKLIKDNFKEIVFDYYRTYLNNTLNYLLSDVTFKLYWNINSELTFSNIRNGYNAVSKVQLASNMEIAFMGLSLIYTIHVLNVKNNISHIFIDELSGALNRGTGLTYDAKDYQELFVKIINKFKDKSIFIIDHHIQNLFETICYQVTPEKDGSVYKVLE